jgi:hypothetical protein
MNHLTAEDFDGHSDEELRQGIGVLLILMSDPMCEADAFDEAHVFMQEIREELSRRANESGGTL